MTSERKPVENTTPEFDAKKVESELKEQEKQNLKDADETKNADGEKKYMGGPIPR